MGPAKQFLLASAKLTKRPEIWFALVLIQQIISSAFSSYIWEGKSLSDILSQTWQVVLHLGDRPVVQLLMIPLSIVLLYRGIGRVIASQERETAKRKETLAIPTAFIRHFYESRKYGQAALGLTIVNDQLAAYQSEIERFGRGEPLAQEGYMRLRFDPDDPLGAMADSILTQLLARRDGLNIDLAPPQLFRSPPNFKWADTHLDLVAKKIITIADNASYIDEQRRNIMLLQGLHTQLRQVIETEQEKWAVEGRRLENEIA